MRFIKKVVMLGDFSVGKSSLVKRFVEQSFSESYLQTIGVNIMKKTIMLDENQTVLMLWDVEGSYDRRSISAQYLKGSNGLVVVIDRSRPETFESLPVHLQVAEAQGLPFFIALNKSDLDAAFDVDAEAIRVQYPHCQGVIETSAKADRNVSLLFEELCRAMLHSA